MARVLPLEKVPQLPCRPALRSGESLYGWLDRLAAANGLLPGEFRTLTGIPHRSPNGRGGLSPDWLRRVCRLSGESEDAIAESFRPYDLAMTHMPLRLLSATDAACWACTDEYGIERAMWAFDYAVACLRHGTYLTRRCFCKHEITHKNKSSAVGLAHCTCFCSGYKAREETSTAPRDVMLAQAFFRKAFEDDEAVVGDRLVRSKDLFACMDVVKKMMCLAGDLCSASGAYSKAQLLVLHGQSPVRASFMLWQYFLIQQAPELIHTAVTVLRSSGRIFGGLFGLAHQRYPLVRQQLDQEAENMRIKGSELFA